LIHDGSHVYGKEIIMVIESTPISNFLSFVLHMQYYYFSFFFFGRGVKRDGVIFHFLQHMCVIIIVCDLVLNLGGIWLEVRVTFFVVN